MKKDCFKSGNNKNCAIVSNTPLDNPVVNILPKIMPSTMNQKNSNQNLSKNTWCVNETTKSKDLSKTTNIETSNMLRNFNVTNTERTSSCNNSLKTTTLQDEGGRNMRKNELTEINENDIVTTSSITSRDSKFSKKSQIVRELPQLRRTTPRLAKTKSAQNMKLMAQVLGPKGVSSNCSALKSREKNDSHKNLKRVSSLPKIVSLIILQCITNWNLYLLSLLQDNEDEIAELMLASTTIRKDSVSRKKAKEARELENIKRILESENPLNEEERSSSMSSPLIIVKHLNQVLIYLCNFIRICSIISSEDAFDIRT